MDTLKWPECNSDEAMVGSVVCTVYTDGQPHKLCVLCQTGLRVCNENLIFLFLNSMRHQKIC